MQEMDWRKSSRCGNTTCVEVAQYPDGTIGLRDNKNLGQPPLRFSLEDWVGFLSSVEAGDFSESGSD